jgi:hypothetical protein
MPTYTRWSIQLAFLYLLLSWFLEILRTGQPFFSLPGWLLIHRVTVFHLFFVGWLTQTIFGVAYWLFPTKSRQSPRGPVWLAFASFFTLNLGLVLRLGTEPFPLLRSHSVGAWALLLSAILHWVSAFLFAIIIWGRIRGKKGKSDASS